jgi:hypothetical protein
MIDVERAPGCIAEPLPAKGTSTVLPLEKRGELT